MEEWMGLSDKDYVEKIVLKEMGLNFETARIHRIGVLNKRKGGHWKISTNKSSIEKWGRQDQGIKEIA